MNVSGFKILILIIIGNGIAFGFHETILGSIVIALAITFIDLSNSNKEETNLPPIVIFFLTYIIIFAIVYMIVSKNQSSYDFSSIRISSNHFIDSKNKSSIDIPLIAERTIQFIDIGLGYLIWGLIHCILLLLYFIISSIIFLIIIAPLLLIIIGSVLAGAYGFIKLFPKIFEITWLKYPLYSIIFIYRYLIAPNIPYFFLWYWFDYYNRYTAFIFEFVFNSKGTNTIYKLSQPFSKITKLVIEVGTAPSVAQVVSAISIATSLYGVYQLIEFLWKISLKIRKTEDDKLKKINDIQGL